MIGWSPGGVQLPRFVPFHALIEAVTGAVDEAQAIVEQGQLDALRPFLDGDRPRTLDLSLPSMRGDAVPGERDVYTVPLLALAPHNPVRIKTVEVQFEVELGELDPREDVNPRQATTGSRSRLTVDPAASADPAKRATQARVTLVVEAVERPEAISRLIDDLLRTQGFVPRPNADGPTPPPTDTPPRPIADPPRPPRAPRTTPEAESKPSPRSRGNQP